MEHASRSKRLSECVGCGVDDSAAGTEIDCLRGEDWFLCKDCDGVFEDGFDCTNIGAPPRRQAPDAGLRGSHRATPDPPCRP
ncbi:Hypothetical protein CAP_3630 [Chondromyces apiculatus DSM 436]|uniref:Uncharacterized protein n=1 Tax=Chondromyces apiculatus DSM 436 TaxID=1192034 RepID=A0A017T8E0_9BACT|nr:Hypothetical protein CAP_3630 [Chondromyces apiculatus DSM 436]